MRDITGRVQAEEELRLHGQILNKMSEGVILIRTGDGVIVYANPRFENMFQYEAGDLSGKHIRILSAPGNRRRGRRFKVNLFWGILLVEGWINVALMSIVII